MTEHYYLDANAHVPKRLGLTTKSKRILADVEDSYIAHGHPLSPNKLGKAASAAIETARDRVAKCFNVNSHEIHFTRSCTEANALVCNAMDHFYPSVNWSPYEHHSMSAPLEAIVDKSFMEELKVDSNGQPILKPKLGYYDFPMTSCIYVGVQPEIGLIADFKRLRENTSFLLISDLAQAAGKIHLDLPALGIDVATFGAHKFGGPLGVGFIYANSKLKDDFIEFCFMNFYEAERYVQDVPGTLSVVDIVETSLALQDSIASIDNEYNSKKRKCLGFRKVLEEGLEGLGCKVICKDQNRIYNTTFVRVPGVDNGILLLKKLADHNIHVGLGSACGSFVIQDSTVMQALGMKESGNISYIRISQNGEYDERHANIILDHIYKSLKEMGV
jgi:cysteine desulfurase